MYIRRGPLLLRIIDKYHTIMLVDILNIRFIVYHIALHNAHTEVYWNA